MGDLNEVRFENLAFVRLQAVVAYAVEPTT